MGKGNRAPSVIDQLRQAVRDSGLSQNALAKRARVAQSQLSRFLRGERTLTLPAAARVCDVIGLELVRRERATGKGSGRERQRPADGAGRRDRHG